MLSFNNKLISIGGKLTNWTPPPPGVIPNDMDFVYFANDFDGTKIPNRATNSTFGDYLQYGTLTKNDSGSSCYLSNDRNYSNYLGKQLTTDELNNIEAVDNTYTFFIRMMMVTSGGCGGVMSTRLSSGGYNYMIRCESLQLQIHTSSGRNLGSDFMMNVDRVYKVQIHGSSFYAKNLETNAEYNLTYSGSRSMGTLMTSFNAGYSGEGALDRFYAFAGIARETTASEDDAIKDVLMNQSL